jgi:hypothetical protein
MVSLLLAPELMVKVAVYGKVDLIMDWTVEQPTIPTLTTTKAKISFFIMI